MPDYTRYAIYYLPPAGALARFGAAWLGWDAGLGRAVPHPGVPGLPAPVADLTVTPRKYGFHATLKPPFRLAEGCDPAELEAAVAALAGRLAPARAEALVLSRLGGFLALVPSGPVAGLGATVGRIVTDLDGFRAPPTEADLARRRSRGLTDRQDAMLLRWGYPYVLDEFRFHMTLSGKLPPDTAEAAELALSPVVAPLLPAPFRLDQIALVGEGADGRFRAIRRYSLTGTAEA